MGKMCTFISSAVIASATARAQIVSYECTSFPEDEGWEHIDVLFPADRWLQEGWLHQQAEIAAPGPPQVSEEDLYRQSLGDFDGAATFFLDWRMETDGTQKGFPNISPAAIVAGGFAGVLYHFTIAENQVRLIRDTLLPVVFAHIEPGTAHTFRLELFGDEWYSFYVDGRLIDSGIPEGRYPTTDSRITFGARAGLDGETTRWDYVRFGVIPAASSGDFDSDADRDLRDFYFFEECLRNGGSGTDAAPSCTWADMDADGDADLLDFAEFQVAFTPE